jgi:asparagine N-glycosylation enzyme membrane subunit Stt3
MATANSIINRAMRIARVIGKGETLDADEAADGLVALNSMLDSWQIDRLYVYQIRAESFTWAANQQSRTVYASGNFATDVPTQVSDDCTFTSNGVEYPAKLIDVDMWSSIPVKTTTSTLPWYLYVEYGSDRVTLYTYPIPSADITFTLRSTKRLQSFSALTDTLTLPSGYEEAITFNLAERFGTEFGKELLPAAQRTAINSRKNLKRVNSPSPVMGSEVGRMNWPYAYNIYTDQP